MADCLSGVSVMLSAQTIRQPVSPDRKYTVAEQAAKSYLLDSNILTFTRIIGVSAETERALTLDYHDAIRDYTGAGGNAVSTEFEIVSNITKPKQLDIRRSRYLEDADTFSSVMQIVYSILAGSLRTIDKAAIEGALYENTVRKTAGGSGVFTAEQEGAIVIDAYEDGVTVDTISEIELAFMRNAMADASLIQWFTNALSMKQLKESGFGVTGVGVPVYSATAITSIDSVHPIKMHAMEAGRQSNLKYFREARDGAGALIIASNGSTVIETMATVPGNLNLVYSVPKFAPGGLMPPRSMMSLDPTRITGPISLNEMVSFLEDAPSATNRGDRRWFSEMLLASHRINPGLVALIRVQSGVDADGVVLPSAKLYKRSRQIAADRSSAAIKTTIDHLTDKKSSTTKEAK